MTDRATQINDFFNRIKAAHSNGIREWHEHGETGALRGFVGMLEAAAAGLQHLLGGVRLTSEQEAEAAKVFVLKQEIEAASSKAVSKSKELAEMLAKPKAK